MKKKELGLGQSSKGKRKILIFGSICIIKGVKKTSTALKFWVSSCKKGVPHMQTLPCVGMQGWFDQSFPNW